MGEASIGCLPCDDDLLDEHDNHDHPAVRFYTSLFIEIDEKPSHCPAEDPDGEKELHRFDPCVYPENGGVGDLPHKNADESANEVQRAEVIQQGVSVSELGKEVHVIAGTSVFLFPVTGVFRM